MSPFGDPLHRKREPAPEMRREINSNAPGETIHVTEMKAILSILNRGFGTDFQSVNPELVATIPAEVVRHGDVTLFVNAIDAESTRIVIHICDHTLGTFALQGLTALPCTPILRRLADVTCLSVHQQLQSIQGRVEVEFLTQQVSQDFEEMTWLRKCGSAIQLVGMQSSIDDLAELILGSLLEVIHSQQIAMVVYSAPVTVDPAVLLPSGGAVRSFGETVFGEEHVCELAQGYGRFGLDRPYVSNEWGDPKTDSRIEVILASIRMETKLFGWLVAVKPGRAVSETNRANDHEFSFGSLESSLLASAGSFLASFEHSRMLFADREDLLMGVVRALVNTIDAKDPYTCGHSDRVAAVSRILGKQLGLDATACDQIHLAGLLHDIGKIGVPDVVLLKPGPLTAEEFELLKQHPVIGYQVLKELKQMSYVLDGVLYHHESLDGTGYPDGLSGDEIPLAARIIAVADAFDAMTSDRPYRRGMPVEKAEAILQSNQGPQWDPRVLQAFFDVQNQVNHVCFQRAESVRTGEESRTRPCHSVVSVH